VLAIIGWDGRFIFAVRQGRVSRRTTDARLAISSGRARQGRIEPLAVGRARDSADLLIHADVDRRTTHQIIEAARPHNQFRSLRQARNSCSPAPAKGIPLAGLPLNVTRKL